MELFYVDDKKSDTFSFYDRLRAKAHTTGMLLDKNKLGQASYNKLK